MAEDWETVIRSFHTDALRPVWVVEQETDAEGRRYYRSHRAKRTLANCLTMMELHELWHEERAKGRQPA